MGVQRQDMQDKPAKRKGGFLWNKLPRLINLAHYEMKQDKNQRDEVLDFEPIHLHITPSQVHPIVAAVNAQQANSANIERGVASTQELELDTFRFIMEQVPAVRTIEFSGGGNSSAEPFRNADLMSLVEYAYKFNGAESTIITDGFLLHLYTDQILKSPLRTLLVRIHAHRPSAFALVTGVHANQFVTIRNNVETLCQRKKQLNSNLEIDLVMTIDRHNITEVPQMIAFAKQLGVAGIRFENYLSPEAGKPSDRSLYTNQKKVIQLLEYYRKNILPFCGMAVTLPTLLDPDMSNHRNCLDPFTTVSVDADCNITGCSRQLLYRGQMGKIWDKDFWNNEMYQWLRGVHGNRGKNAAQGLMIGDRNAEVPKPCQTCPKNMRV